MNPDGLSGEVFLRATGFIDSENDEIRRVAREICEGASTPEQRAVRLFTFVRDEIRYNAYMISTHPEDFKASTTLGRQQGYCVQKAILFAALGRASGIPTRLVFAKIRNHRLSGRLMREIGTNMLPAHGYNQLYVGERWVSVTPSFERALLSHHTCNVV